MATNETQSDKQKTRKTESEVPAGFDTRVGRERGDGWLKKTAGQVIVGRLLGRFGMKGQTNDDGSVRVFYQVQLAEGCKMVKDGKEVEGVFAMWQNPDNKDDKQEVVLTAGQIVNIDEHKALEDLGPYTRNGGIYDVWMKYLAEDPIPGKKNRTFWRMKGPHLKTIKPATRRPDADTLQEAVTEGEDNIPF